MQGSRGEAFSQEIWDWAFEQVPKIAARYPAVEAAELKAELAKQLLEIRREPSPKPRDWKAYLIKCLLNAASRLAKQWRRRRDLEPSMEDISPTSELSEPVERPGAASDLERELRLLQQRVSNAERRLLKQLRDCDGNVSLLARRLGVHRNTIHRHLRKIRRAGCPIEIETAANAAGLPGELERAQLAAIIQTAAFPTRQALRARVLLALLDGLTYAEIVRRLGTSRATIARWRARFVRRGMAGLKVKYPRKKPSPRRERLSQYLRPLPVAKWPSVRQLARQFGVGKSTAQRIVKLTKAGALSRAETL